jgi:hypothetical protein
MGIDRHDIDRIKAELALHKAVDETFAALVIWESAEGDLTYVPFTTYKQAERASARATNPNHVLVRL